MQLASEQIKAVNTFGAFMDGVQAVVPVVLLQRVLADVAGAAEDLHADVRGDNAVLRRIGLDHRNQQVEQFAGIAARLFLGCGMGIFVQAAGIQTQRQAAFGVGFLLQQQASHVGVFDDAHLRRQRILATRPTTLGTLPGIVQRPAETLVSQRRCTQSNADARFVHHLEHVGQALVGLTHQVTDGTGLFTEIQYGRGGVAITQFVQQAGQGNIIAGARGAVVIDQELGHQKQRNAPSTGRCTFDSRKHQVHDVVS
ncbi:hypothetical protein D3C76_957880 [compost metagenome]